MAGSSGVGIERGRVQLPGVHGTVARQAELDHARHPQAEKVVVAIGRTLERVPEPFRDIVRVGITARVVASHEVVRDPVADPVCGFQDRRSCAKASGARPARWQSRTAMVWLASLRRQRATRCHSSRARTRLAL
jgi:hypothetical protein